MVFFQSAVGVLQTLVIAFGAGLGIWGVRSCTITKDTVHNKKPVLRYRRRKKNEKLCA